MKYIIGKKLGMSQKFKTSGESICVTAIQAGPCIVTQVKNQEKDGYTSVQLGFDKAKEKNTSKPKKGHLKGLELSKNLKEIRITGEEIKLKRGDKIDATQFASGDIVKVTGFSKGHGFQGVVKRHGFHGHPASHGHKDQLRMPGSIATKRIGPVSKGKRMAGHMGDAQISLRNLEIVEVDAAKNILYIKGAVPGARNGLVIIYG